MSHVQKCRNEELWDKPVGRVKEQDTVREEIRDQGQKPYKDARGLSGLNKVQLKQEVLLVLPWRIHRLA